MPFIIYSLRSKQKDEDYSISLTMVYVSLAFNIKYIYFLIIANHAAYTIVLLGNFFVIITSLAQLFAIVAQTEIHVESPTAGPTNLTSLYTNITDFFGVSAYNRTGSARVPTHLFSRFLADPRGVPSAFWTPFAAFFDVAERPGRASERPSAPPRC